MVVGGDILSACDVVESIIVSLHESEPSHILRGVDSVLVQGGLMAMIVLIFLDLFY